MHSYQLRKPTAEHIEHTQRVRSRRLSVHQREEPKHPPKATYGQWSPRPIEEALTQDANLGSDGRRLSYPSGSDDHAIDDSVMIQAHKASLLGEHGQYVKDSADEKRVPLPEKSELRNIPRSVSPGTEVTQTNQILPKGTVTRDVPAKAYEPTYLLRQNAEYLDHDQNGVIWPKDTYKGCRKLGWGIPSSCLAMLALHSTLSYHTCPGYMPDPFIRIRYENTHHGKLSDGNNTSYNEKGPARLDQACESILAKYDARNKGGLSFRDILRFWDGQRALLNVYGWSITVLEWSALYMLLWPRDGVMRSDDIRAAFDGSILYKRAEERRRRIETHRRQSGSGTCGSNGKRFNPVKLAMLVMVGLAILVWALRNLARIPPAWAAYLWKK
ncbi:Caleosin related protein-domain-containing protein [Hypoxylon crocopeplum]|nr:Caleosin related protein-domain-containing protein [Hypoxylon crocopeplum]